MYTDGFMSNDFQMAAFNHIHGNLFHDFQNSVFKIVPVLNYKWTQKLLRDVVYADFTKLQKESLVKERKNIINSMKTNLDGEVTSNTSLTQKLTGTPLIFGSSQFMLVHVTSLKILTLNDENPEDLRFQLRDFPEEGSVLKFTPCLNFQKLRTNIVYNQDAVYLSSVKAVCNRSPSLYTSYKGTDYKFKDTKDKKLKKQFENEVKASKQIASIEYSTRWRIEAYYIAGNEEKKAHQDEYLRVGDVIGLYLSEMKLYLNALKPYDPFKKILSYLNVENQTLINQQLVQNPNESKMHLLTKTSIKRVEQTKPDDITLLKKILIDDVIVAFQDFEYFSKRHEKNKQNDLPTSCFWKVESSDQMSGGLLDWNKTYRLRHFQTGRYLQIKRNKDLVDMELVSNGQEKTLFKFVQIQNFEDQDKAIKRDSFFYLWHCETRVYLGISDEVKILHPIIEQTCKDQEVMLKQGYLSVVQNHFTTFRMKKIEFEHTWETSLLQFSLPYFLEAIGFIQKISAQPPVSSLTVYNDDDIKSKLYFYQIFLRVFRMLDTYQEFVNNKLISNISGKQEYSMIVPGRQNVVRDQNIFILLIWMLFRCFPSKEIIELQTETYQQIVLDFLEEKDFMFRVQSFLQNNTLQQHPRMIRKLDESHHKRMVVLSYKVYMTVQDFCMNNKNNQKTLLKLINIIHQHIGLGDQVVDTLICSIQNAKSILQSLPKVMVTLQRPQEPDSITDGQVKPQKQTTNTILAIIMKLQEFPPYSKPDIIKLLAAICSTRGKPVYVNQNLIYRSFIENKAVYNHAFMKLQNKFGDLLVHCTDRNNQPIILKFLDFFDESQQENPNYVKQYEYIKNQLSLITNLCLSRNAVACKNFQQIFSLNKLISYIGMEKLDYEIRAVLLKMIRVLYIDQEPYQHQKRPELVREIVYDKDILQRIIIKRETGILSMFKTNDGKNITLHQVRQLTRKPLITQESILYQTIKKKKFRQQQPIVVDLRDEDDSDVEESEEVQKFLSTLTTYLLEFLKAKYEQLLMNMPSAKVYNLLTLEAIQIVGLILKFGFFNYDLMKPANKFTRNYLQQLKEIEEQIKNSEIEKIINYLAYFLEYDENYFQALNAVQIQRRHAEQKLEREEKANKKIGLDDFTNLDLNVMNLLDQKEKTKKERKVIHQDREMETVADPLFKKVKGLKKVLEKCSNKTFTFKDDSSDTNYEVLIKTEICHIFLYLLDLRQDFLIDNSIEYFKDVYVPYTVSKLNEPFKFQDLLSETALEIGQDITEIKLMEEYTLKCQIVRHFDLIIEKPFYEVLLLALYFSQNSKLQNTIVELIQRYSSQKQKLIHNIIDLQVVVAPEIVAFYKKWSKLLNNLKRNIPNCQAWLQLDTPQKLNGRNEVNFHKNLKLMQKIIDLFGENQIDNQRMKIKQRIFKHVGGFDSLLVLIHSCTVMINNNRQVFYFKEVQSNFEQYQQNLANLILKLLEKVLQVMTIFTLNSVENQELVFHKLIHTLSHNRANNFGQVRFTNQLFNDNPKLTQQIQRDREIINYFKLIKTHGRYAEFLDFFIIILKNAESNNTGQSDIISTFIVTFILDKVYYESVVPYIPFIPPKKKYKQYYPHLPQETYKGKFLIILAQCLKNYIGVSLVNRAQQTFRLPIILQLLIEVSMFDMQTPSEQFDQMHVKTSIFEVIIILLEKTEKVNQEIMSCSSLIQEFLRLEISFLNARTQFSTAQQTYLFKKQSIFLLKYFKTFLKDASAQIFSNSEVQKQERKVIQEYGKAFLQALSHMSNPQLMEDPQKIQMIEHICQVIKLDIPKQLRRVDDEEDDLVVEEEEIVDDITRQLDPTLIDGNNKRICNTGPPLMSASGVRGVLQKFKSLKLKHIGERKENEDQDSLQINQYWLLFVSLFSDNDEVIHAIKHEKQVFARSVWNVNRMFQSSISLEQKDLVLNSEDVVKNLLQYLQYASYNNADTKSVLFVLRVLRSILKDAMQKEDDDIDEDDDPYEELRERQEIFNKLNATRILMGLLWNEEEHNLEYLSTLLSLFCMMLKGGNLVVQNTIYEYSVQNQECEKMYYKLQMILSHYINANPAELKQNGKLQGKTICKALQFIQLLCEGHNTRMQEYLHFQSNSKNSYDLVLLVVKLLQCIKIDNKNYTIVMQCLDTLTEVIQGPCKMNQVALSNSKFLDYVVDILSENDRIFETLEITQTHDPKIMSVIYQQATLQNLKLTQKIAAPRIDSSKKPRGKIMDQNTSYNLTLHLAKLARLKLKALTTLVGLVECCDPSDNLILRIIRAIPINVLTNNISRIYTLFLQQYKDEYVIELFGRADDFIDTTIDEEKYELLIEIGFQIYILMQTFIASKKGKDIMQEDIDMRDVINEFDVDKTQEDDKGLFGGIGKLGGDFLSAGLGGLNKIKQEMEAAMKSEEEKRKEKELLEQKEKQDRKDHLKQSIRFFKKHSCSIEIVRQGEVFQVYFPKLPFCDQLPKDLRAEFHDNVNRSSAKTKLMELMTASGEIIKTMKHEEDLRILFSINPIFGFIASQGKLWELCLFITTIVLNLIICLSYSQFFVVTVDGEDPSDYALQQSRLYDPRLLFYKELTVTKQIITIFGLLDLAFSSLIVFFFLLKRAPLKVYHIWHGFFKIAGFFKIVGRFTKNTIWSTAILLQDFEILYYSAYILAGIVGLAAHPFLFSVHLMDFLKLEQLKTVVQAMWKPKVELGLALMLLIILEYYFSILAWMVFFDQYPASEDSGQKLCTEFWRCFFITFDWTFKFTGSIGAQLQDPNTDKYLEQKAADEGIEYAGYNYVSQDVTDIYYGRFFFDNIFNIILVFILLNMIQGIIIDTFGSLREEQVEKNLDMTTKCFICGIEMEKLDKSSDSDKGFEFHIKYEHYMWNYIFYRAYLEFKDSTEYDGNESYVKDNIDDSDLQWLPIKMARCIQDDEKEVSQKLDSMDVIIHESDKLEETLIKLLPRVEQVRDRNIIENT